MHAGNLLADDIPRHADYAGTKSCLLPFLFMHEPQEQRPSQNISQPQCPDASLRGNLHLLSLPDAESLTACAVLSP